MLVDKTEIPDLLLIKPRVFGDPRGYFYESYQADRYRTHAIDCLFIQDNVSRSSKGILRGLHFQYPFAQAKLISVLKGSIFDVAVDLRRHSPTFGKWFGTVLSDENKHQLFIPKGFAHGFYILSEEAICHYKTDEYYHPECEFTLKWDDSDVGIQWPLSDTPPQLSAKDASGKTLKQLPNNF